MKAGNTKKSYGNRNKQSLKTDIHSIKLERVWQLFSKSLVNNPKLSSFYEPLIQPFLPGWSTEGYRSEVIGRYPEMSEKVKVVLEKQGIPYNTGSFFINTQLWFSEFLNILNLARLSFLK